MALDGLEDLLNNLQAFDAHTELLTIVDENGERINELMQQQLSEGKDMSGQVRIDEYRPLTLFFKRTDNRVQGTLGAVTDRVTFYMYGNLYKSMTTVMSGDDFSVESPLPTFDKMVNRIGDDEYGLDPEERLNFATEITIPKFAEALQQKTGLVLNY